MTQDELRDKITFIESAIDIDISMIDNRDNYRTEDIINSAESLLKLVKSLDRYKREFYGIGSVDDEIEVNAEYESLENDEPHTDDMYDDEELFGDDVDDECDASELDIY